jgi:hypothetical protein
VLFIIIIEKKSQKKFVRVNTRDQSVNEPVSLSTVKRCLLGFGMNGRVACKKALLRKVNIRKRLKVAEEHVK